MNQIIENVLNLAFDATKEDLSKSQSLETGYDWNNNTWEVIVKHTGSLEMIHAGYKGIFIEELLNFYAIIRADKETIEALSREKEIIYIEKPKRMNYEINNGLAASCINSLWAVQPQLTGKGVIVAIIDSGIDVTSDEFRDSEGNTRILNIYDQITNKEYTREDINNYLKSGDKSEAPGYDILGHGTDVAQIACGNSGVASGSDIIVVKMGQSYNDSFPRTTSLMEGVDYVVRKSMEYNRPVVINLSFGNNYGDHIGNTIVEMYLDDIIKNYRCQICIGSGNEADKSIHSATSISSYAVKDIELAVGEYETGLDIQIWKEYWDDMEIYLQEPSGELSLRIDDQPIKKFDFFGTRILSITGEPSPFNVNQEIYIDMIPLNQYITTGVWKIHFKSNKVKSGNINMWLPSSAVSNESTGFLYPEADNTFTIPGTTGRAITVGAYNSYTGAYAPFSGRGNPSGRVKPDIVAPGVNITLSRSSNGRKIVRTVSGTSYATPFVTGSVAILMQWGIVQGHDVFLYGEKVKSYIIKGASGVYLEPQPSNKVGWGRLCLRNSFQEQT